MTTLGHDLDTSVVGDSQTRASQDNHTVSADAIGPVLPRRRFLGYLVAGPTLVAAAGFGVKEILSPEQADAATAPATSGPSVIPSPPEPADLYDLSDLLTDAALPTSNLITVVVNKDGSVSFALPRAEVGQGITTSTAMIIADELDIPLDKVNMTLADARPDLLFNQLTGGSNTIHAMYTPLRVAAAAAKAQLVHAASAQLGVDPSQLSTSNGIVTAADGRSLTYGDLAGAAAVTELTSVPVELKPDSELSLIGKPTGRIDAHEIVTGTKLFTMDLEVPGAKPAMIARPPTIQGTVKSVKNADAVKKMPGILHVVTVAIGLSGTGSPGGDAVAGGTGVAIVGDTFGQCIDAIQALEVTWGQGTEDGRSDDDIVAELKKAEFPLAVPSLPLLAKTVEQEYTFYFVSNSPLESNCAVADVKKDSAEIWQSFKVPITAQQEIAQTLKLPQDAVVCHVAQGGGSFGRHLFPDAGLEAARISQAVGKPVRLMYSRTDDFRHGRVHPMAVGHARANYLGKEVLTYEQRHTGVSTDYGHGLGEILTAFADKLPGGNLTFAESIFALTANVPYNLGITDQLLNEVDYGFQTGSMRNVYSPAVCTVVELMVEQLAQEMGIDSLEFRRTFVKGSQLLSVLDKVADEGKWGRKMPAGTAQGLAVHHEYKGYAAALVEIDCRPETVNRKIYNAYTGPRVTKIVYAVDPGLTINPLGFEAMVMGGCMDGIGRTLTMSMHLDQGHWKEGSWDNFYYTRQWNVPEELDIYIMPTSGNSPGGAGEFAVSASMAGVATAYARATGKIPNTFPINHNLPLGFTPYPLEPSTPQSPTNGLDEENDFS